MKQNLWKKIFSFTIAFVMAFPLIVVTAPSTVHASTDITAAFADAKFLSKVRQVLGKGTSDPIYNSDVSGITALNLNSIGISDLSGIEYFTSLTNLDCDYNLLATLDMSGNPELISLSCMSNQLTSLNLSKNPKLASLNCYGNKLTSLDVSNNPALTALGCGSNQLTSLNISNNPALKGLNCGFNNLPSLDLSNTPALTNLYCQTNQLTSLDISDELSLTEVYCYENKLTSLNVSNTPALITLNCFSNELATLDVSESPALITLDCYSNNLTSLDVSGNLSLTSIHCYSNQLTSLNLGDNCVLNLIYCSNNRLSSLDVSKDSALYLLTCQNNYLPSKTAIIGLNETTVSTFAFNPQYIAPSAISVPVPAAGQTPVSSIAETPQYTGTVTWSPYAETFGYDTIYTATINLALKPGNLFDFINNPVETYFTIPGAATTNTTSDGAITAVFPKTESVSEPTTSPSPTPTLAPMPTPTTEEVTPIISPAPATPTPTQLPTSSGAVVTIQNDVDKLIIRDADTSTATVDLSQMEGVTAVAIPNSLLNDIQADDSNGSKKTEVLELKLPEGTITISPSAAANIVNQNSGGNSVKISVTQVDTTATDILTPEQAEQVGDRPVYTLSMQTDKGDPITQFGGNVQVSLPYTLKDGENPNAIIIYYVSADGTLQIMPNCQYDAASGMVTFMTTHFSAYMIAHNPVTFDDIDGHWAQNVIEQAASRDLVHGYGDGNYQPNGDVTRAEFIQMVNSVLNLPTPTTSAAPYTDVTSGSWYFNSVASAKAAGLLNGLAGSAFNPNQPITREEMAVVLANVVYYKGVVVGDADLSNFTDLGGVSDTNLTAIETAIGAGLLSADGMGGGIFDPNGVTTRGQAAEIQMNLLNVLGQLS